MYIFIPYILEKKININYTNNVYDSGFIFIESVNLKNNSIMINNSQKNNNLLIQGKCIELNTDKIENIVDRLNELNIKYKLVWINTYKNGVVSGYVLF